MMTRTARVTLICIGLILFSLVLIHQNYAAVDMSSVMAIWLFDEASGDKIIDSTGNGNDGTLINEPAWVTGKFDTALSFDGDDDYVEINNPVNFVDPNYTIMLWVNPGAVQDKAHTDILSNHGEPPPAGYCIEQWSTNVNQFYTAFTDGTKWWAGFPDEDVPLTQMTPDVWQHFAVVRDGGTVTHYLNGEETGKLEGITEEPVAESPHNLLISNFGWGTIDRQFNGSIDELAIINSALSLEDIQRSMNDGLQNVTAVSESGKLCHTWAGIKVLH